MFWSPGAFIQEILGKSGTMVKSGKKICMTFFHPGDFGRIQDHKKIRKEKNNFHVRSKANFFPLLIHPSAKRPLFVSCFFNHSLKRKRKKLMHFIMVHLLSKLCHKEMDDEFFLLLLVDMAELVKNVNIF